MVTSFTAAMKKYFGLKEGQTSAQFSKELKDPALTCQDKAVSSTPCSLRSSPVSCLRPLLCLCKPI